MQPVLNDPAARVARGPPRYFEMLVPSRHPGHRRLEGEVTHHDPGKPFDDDRWELYRLSEDCSELRGGPGRARAEEAAARMIELW